MAEKRKGNRARQTDASAGKPPATETTDVYEGVNMAAEHLERITEADKQVRKLEAAVATNQIVLKDSKKALAVAQKALCQAIRDNNAKLPFRG